MATYQSQYTGAQIDSAYLGATQTFATYDDLETGWAAVKVGQLCLVKYNSTLYYKANDSATTPTEVGVSGVSKFGGATGEISIDDNTLAMSGNMLSAITQVQIYTKNGNMIITTTNDLPTETYGNGVKLVFTTVAPTTYLSGYLYLIIAS